MGEKNVNVRRGTNNTRVRVAALSTAVAAALSLIATPAVQAAGTIIYKANNATDLSTSGSFVTASGGTTAATPPSTSTGTNNSTPEIVEYDSTVTGVNTARTGGGTAATLAVDGIIIANPGGAVTINLNNGTLTIGSSGIDMSNATQDLTLAQSGNPFGGTVRIGPNATAAIAETWTVAGGRNLNVNASLNLAQGGTNTLTLAGTGNVNINGTISQSTGAVGKLTVNGATVTLSGASDTASGQVTITSGVLNVGNGGTGGFLGSQAVADNATLNFNYSSAAAAVTVANVISGTGTVNEFGGGTVNLTGANSFTGNVTVNGGTLNASTTANTAAATSSPLGNPSTAGRTITVASGATLAFTGGNVLGSGGSTSAQSPKSTIIVNQGGTLAAAVATGTGTGGGDANIFGPITLNGGTFTTGNGFGADYQAAILLGTVTVGGASPSTFNTNATNTTANSAMLGGATAGTNAITFNVADATGTVSSDFVVSVPLANSAVSASQPANLGALIKTGAGTLALSGTSTYSGGTTINNGTVVANSFTNSLGTGPATVNDGGVLAGGTIAGGATSTGTGLVTIAGGKITAGSGATAGDTPGYLMTAAQNWSSGSFVAKVAGINTGGGPGGSTTNDLLVMSGLTVTNGFAVNLLATTGSNPAFTVQNTDTSGNINALQPGSYVILAKDSEDVSTNPFANTATIAALNAAFTNTGVSPVAGDAVNLAGYTDSSSYYLIAEDVATPEPTSLLLAGVAAAPLVLGRRRRTA